MTTLLHQMNVRYLPVEDRLLLRISAKNGDEYRIWLTRRYAGILQRVFSQEIERCGGRQILASNQQTTKMYKEGAFEKPYEEKSTHYPLGESGILASRISVNRLQNGDIRLDLSPQQGQGLTLNLNRSLLFMFDNLLSQGILQAGWNSVGEGQGSSRVH